MKDDQNRREAARWLGQADSDLRFARVGLAEGFYAQVCFLAQQAAEKAVKAAHYRQGERRVLGHSLVVLLDTLPANSGAEGLRTLAAELDLHYVPARYPNGLPDLAPFEAYTREQAEHAIEAAQKFLDFARASIV